MKRKTSLALTLFVCMALVSCMKSALEQAIEATNKKCPIDMGIMTIEKLEFQEGNVYFHYLIDETLVNVSELAKQPEILKASLLTIFSNPDEDMRSFLKLMVDEKSDLHAIFKAKTSEDKAEVVLSADELKTCLDDESTTPDDKLKSLIQTTNLQLPTDLQNGIVIRQCILEGKTVFYIYEVNEEFYDQEMIKKQVESGILKQNLTLALKSSDDMSKRFFNAIVNANKGLGYRYVGTTSGNTVEVTFTNEELKEIL